MNEIESLKSDFLKRYNHDAESLITAGGRLEIIGNHTDHNHGLCIVGNCSLRIKALVSKRNDNLIQIDSKGHSYFEFDATSLGVREEEYNTTKGMVRGIAARIKELGYNIGGFSAVITSEIPEGSGVSSSAAFEVLIGEILNHLYNDDKIPHITIAKVGQYSENVYFHKPCGLLDQIGAAFKDCNYLDFKDIDNPSIEFLDFNLPVVIYLINSIGDHSNLSHLYAEIPNGMKKVANMLGEEYLRETKEVDFKRLVRDNMIDDPKAIKKATHFYQENKNVIAAEEAIKSNNLELFFKAIRASQNSSHHFLENTFVKGEYEESPQSIIDRVNELPDFEKNGAIRIHGGGFKGSVIAYVSLEYKDKFEKFLEENYKNRYYSVSISKDGVTKENL